MTAITDMKLFNCNMSGNSVSHTFLNIDLFMHIYIYVIQVQIIQNSQFTTFNNWKTIITGFGSQCIDISHFEYHSQS